MHFVVFLSLSVLLNIPLILAAKPKTLVIIKDSDVKLTHSRFFKALKKRGHSLDFRKHTDKGVVLHQFGNYLYDNLVILTPSVSKISDSINTRQLLDFTDNGGNVMVVVDSSTSEMIRKFADRCGLVLHSKGQVYDHLSHDKSLSRGSDSVLVSSDWIKNTPIIHDPPSSPILFKGIGMHMKSRSHLNLNIVQGSSFAYSGQTKKGDSEPSIIKTSSDLALVGALQTRKNARITFVGSFEFLSDKYFTSSVSSSFDDKVYDVSGNEKLAVQISEWTFGERGILRTRNGVHVKMDDPNQTPNPTRYRIKDKTKFSILIEEYRLNCDCWVPFSENDVQFEFVRLDAFVRQLIGHDGKGKYSIEFVLPDVFGVYKYMIHYQRRGWANVHYEKLVSVRPFRHDEYDRFLTAAWPYYAGTMTQLIGFVLFTIVFLFGKNKNGRVW